jgi:hypothetical protein
MVDQLHIKREMTYQLLHEDLGKRKICMRFVPHSLMNDSSFCHDSKTCPGETKLGGNKPLTCPHPGQHFAILRSENHPQM